MRRRLSFLVPSSAVTVAIAVVALVGVLGGWAIAATTKGSPVIRACANKRTGALRLAAKCRHGERRITWNQKGPAGATGATGATGSAGGAGATGATGPQGPGATTFSTSVADGVEESLAVVSGVNIKATCSGSVVELEVETASLEHNLQTSGTANPDEAKTLPIDTNGGLGRLVSSTTSVDIDALVRDRTVGKFARVDVHGEAGPPCTFWGMITPSS
jgi:hypothetical protein